MQAQDTDETETAASEPAKKPKKKAKQASFCRSLDDEAVGEIKSGLFGELLSKLGAEGFDIQLKDGTLVAYWGGTATIAFGRTTKGAMCTMVPRKFAEKLEFPKRLGLKGTLSCFQMDDEFKGALNSQLHALLDMVERADGKDGPLESKFMTSNPGSAGILPLDRNVQFPGVRSKLDIVAVEEEADRRLLLVDIRQGTSADIAKAHVTLEQFYATCSEDGRLKQEYADEYHRMLAQRVELGLPALDPKVIEPGMKVACLLALAHFKTDSTIRQRLLDNTAKLHLPLFMCEFAGSNARVPHQRLWEPLGRARDSFQREQRF